MRKAPITSSRSQHAKHVPSTTTAAKTHGNDPWDGKTQITNKKVTNTEIGIKVVDDQDEDSQVVTAPTVTKFKTARSSSSSARSPKYRRKIQIYEAKRRQTCRSVSPYLCEIARDTVPPKKTGYKEIYVSEAEYRLIQNALSIQTAAQRGAHKIKKTLFGYVYVQSTDAGNPLIGIKDTAVAPVDRSVSIKTDSFLRQSLSQTALAKRSAASKVAEKPGVIINRRKSGFEAPASEVNSRQTRVRQSRSGSESGNQLTAVEPADVVAKVATTSSKPATQSSVTEDKKCVSEWTKVHDLLNHMQHASSSPFETSRETVTVELQARRDSTDEKSSSQLLQDPQGFDASPASRRNYFDNDRKTQTDEMETTIFAAAEASMILMNTLFKDALDDPNTSKKVVGYKLFRKFIGVETETDGLEKAAVLFTAAARSISEYLRRFQGQDANSEQSFDSLSTIGGGQFRLHSLIRDSEKDMTKSKTNSGVVEIRTEYEQENQETFSARNNWNYCANFDKKPFHVTVATSSVPGFLVHTITCKDYEFHLNYIGNSRKVGTLVSSSSSRSKMIQLTPYQLMDILDRSFSAAAALLSAAKYHLSLGSQKLGTVVQEYMEGKYGHYFKSLKKSNKKLQGLNTFAGIILQMTRVLSNAFAALLLASDTYSALSEALKPSQTRAKVDMNEPSSEPESDFGLKKDVIKNFIDFIGEIENASEIGRMSLAAVYSKSNVEIKLKKNLRVILEHIFEAVLQLQTHRERDFAAVIVSGLTTANMLLSSKDNLPAFDVTIRRNLLSNLSTVERNIRDMNSTTSRMNFVADYLASKSMQNLKSNRETAKILENKKAQLKNLPWYRRKLFRIMLERTYSRVSIPSPSGEVKTHKDQSRWPERGNEGSNETDSALSNERSSSA